MKKMLAALLLLFLLTGCSAAGVSAAPNCFSAPFLMTADFVFDGWEGSFSLKSSGFETYTLTYLAPDSVAGMTLDYQEGIVTITHLGIAESCKLEDLPLNHPLRVLCAQAAARPETIKSTGTDDKGNSQYLYEDGSKLTAYGDIPRSVESADARLSIHITGFERPQSQSAEETE